MATIQELIDDQITFDEAATLLRVSRPTLLKGIKEGKIPARKVLGRWMISKKELCSKLGIAP